MSNQNLGRLQILPLNKDFCSGFFGQPDYVFTNSKLTDNWVYTGNLFVLGEKYGNAKVNNLKWSLYQTIALFTFETNPSTSKDGDWFLLDADSHPAVNAITQQHFS